MSDATDSSRRDAKERALRYLLPLLTEAELDEVRDLASQLLAAREDWARHAGDTRWHAVASIIGGSLSTMCSGSWNTLDDYETEARPALADRCAPCQQRYAARQLERMARQRIAPGLAELAAATPIERSR